MIKYFLFFFCAVLLSSINYSQDSTSTDIVNSNEPFEEKAVELQNGFVLFDAAKSPINFTSDEWIQTGAIIGATSLSLFFDKSIRNKVSANHSKAIDRFTSYAEFYGRGRDALAASGLIYIGGLISGSKNLELMGKMLSEALLVTGVYTIGLKFILGRSRPYKNEGPFEIKGLKFQNSDNSLPSGHTSTAFAISTILSRKIDNIYASIALYGLASATAYQRLYSDNHWFSDIFLGAAIGVFVGNKVFNLNNQSEKNSSKSTLSIIPTNVNEGLGLSISYNF